MLTESQCQEQYRRTVYAPAQDARKAYWQSMWERSMHNPLNKTPFWTGHIPPTSTDPHKATTLHGHVEMLGDLPDTAPVNPRNTPPPRSACSKDPWPDARGTPNAPCCREDGDVEAAVSAELARILALFRERQAKYGPKNIAEFGEVGVLVRLYDKLARLRNFYFDGGVGDMADESVEDAWSDISCYAAIALVCKRGRWPGAKPFLGGANRA